jgi:hypothetical protein
MKPPQHLFKSPDESVTGAGYLIPKSTFFVSYSEIPAEYCHTVPWEKLTGRERGFAGEEIVEVLIEHRFISFPMRRAVPDCTKTGQYQSTDGKILWFGEAHYETKTEVLRSSNLCLQTHEGGHKVHLVRDGDRVVRRVTAIPDFEDEIPF